jgi:excisionase family DNA binding protein
MENYLTAREVAKILGVSVRSVYSYIRASKLPALQIGGTIIVHVDGLAAFQRSSVGRKRTQTPQWHIPAVGNTQYLTTMMVQVRQGQDTNLERKLDDFRINHKHSLPGTVGRYITRIEHEPQLVQIVLIWRAQVMPPKEEREAALATLCADLAEVLMWETVCCQEGQVVLHAS